MKKQKLRKLSNHQLPELGKVLTPCNRSQWRLVIIFAWGTCSSHGEFWSDQAWWFGRRSLKEVRRGNSYLQVSSYREKPWVTFSLKPICLSPLGSHEATVESDHSSQTHLVKDGPRRAGGQCHSTRGTQQVHRREWPESSYLSRKYCTLPWIKQ